MQRNIQIGQLVLKLLGFFQAARAFHDNVVQAERWIDDQLIIRQHIRLKPEDALRQREQALDHFTHIGSHHDIEVLLRQQSGFHQHITEIAIRFVGRNLFALLRRDLADFDQQIDQPAIRAARSGVNQLATLEGHTRRVVPALDRQRASLARQMDQVQQLRNTEIVQVPFKRHSNPP